MLILRPNYSIMVNINNWYDVKNRRNVLQLILDVFMLFVVALNLIFIIFDWHFQFDFFQNFLKSLSLDFFNWYKIQIHPNFLLYDFYFVGIFITELLLSWIFSVKNKDYRRWWFYPFVHWYDVLGCIPLGVFRWLRFFRVISMMIKLHKMQVINLKENIFYKLIKDLYITFTNKVTNKVLKNLVTGIHREVTKNVKSEKPKKREGDAISSAIEPDLEVLSKVLRQKIQRIASQNYNQHREAWKLRIETVVRDGFNQSEEIKNIDKLPLVGKQITKTLEASLSDITYQLVDSLFKQVSTDETGKLLEDTFQTTIKSALKKEENQTIAQEDDEELNRILRKVLGRILERIINNIGVEADDNLI